MTSGSVSASGQGGKSEAAAKSASDRLPLFVLAVLLLIGTVLRFGGLTAQSLWFDEAISWSQAVRDFFPMLQYTSADYALPLHNILLHFAIRLFGDSEAALRWPSALFGVASIAAIYWLGSILRQRWVGIAAAILLTFSGFHLWYSHEARPYALLMLLATLFVAALLCALETGKWRWQIAASIGATALLYTHPYGVLLWFSVLAALAVIALSRGYERGAARLCLLWQSLAALCFLPWAVILVSRYRDLAAHGFWLPRPSLSWVGLTFAQVSSGAVMGIALLGGAIVGLLPAAASGNTQTRGGIPVDHWRLILTAWLVGPFLLGLADSLVSTPILLDRYLICSLPPLLLLAGFGYRRLLRGNGVALALTTLLLAIGNWAAYQHEEHEDYRHAVAVYRERSIPGDCVIFFHRSVDVPFRYYARKMPICSAVLDNASDIRPWTLGATRVWLVLGFASRNEEETAIDGLKQHGWAAEAVPNWGVHLYLTYPDRAGLPPAASQP